jgi:hypothetical protein
MVGQRHNFAVKDRRSLERSQGVSDRGKAFREMFVIAAV